MVSRRRPMHSYTEPFASPARTRARQEIPLVEVQKSAEERLLKFVPRSSGV